MTKDEVIKKLGELNSDQEVDHAKADDLIYA